MNITLKVWRQKGPAAPGGLVEYTVSGVVPEMSFLEMLDTLNEQLIAKGEDPLAFDSDCREGICGMCNLMIDGQAHGPDKEATTCQLHMRRYKDGDVVTVEPFRAKGFPLVKDLVVDRSAFDRIQAAGGFVSINTGNAVDGNSNLIPHDKAEKAMDAAACIGCGACVAACPNASAMLFVAAKVSQYALLPQGQPEREKRVLAMREAMDKEGFGHCTNEYECEAACPKGIKLSNIARLNREFLRATLVSE
ncbi:MAG: succinate dehydrogenase/fumarate reductase iron-sulfur subunit [Elusimicrobia bacterium CG11_big_fil_rev_8_21_14_0_20_64_6]|nr:MAG: succinate dehydrogenase/fumarate reductase iron-sulfur subunit [Elusimicrobia bacterium CG11_big_fil_rev_8_21_14_0_20_64_6]